MWTALRLVALSAIAAGAFVYDTLLMFAMTRHLHGNDFGKFYYSTRAFLSGDDMYAPSLASELPHPRFAGMRFLNLNPPHFHLVTLPLAWMDLEHAALTWVGLSLFGLVLSWMLIGHELRIRWTPDTTLLCAAATLAFAGTEAFFATGQLSLFLLALVTVAWVDVRHGRWIRAGVIVGAATSVKPFLLILVPYFVIARRWDAVAAAVAACAGCFAVGLVIFGMPAYLAWIHAVAVSGSWSWAALNASSLGLFSRTFGPSAFYAPLVDSPLLVRGWVLVAAAIAVATFRTLITRGRPLSADWAFALLLVAAQLISPLGWVYYVLLPAGPMVAVAMTQHEQSMPTSRWSLLLIVIAVIGLWAPTELLVAFQPHRWATPTVGSLHFWGTLALWVLLMRHLPAERAVL